MKWVVFGIGWALLILGYLLDIPEPASKFLFIVSFICSITGLAMTYLEHQKEKYGRD